MPYEGNDSMTSEFADQLLVKNNIILNNSNYYVIAGSDFNVDIFRPRGHIATLSSFRFNSDPSFFKKREMSDRQFLLFWYDSFHCLLLLSGVLYNTSINGASATHNTDTLSDDHKTIALYDWNWIYVLSAFRTEFLRLASYGWKLRIRISVIICMDTLIAQNQITDVRQYRDINCTSSNSCHIGTNTRQLLRIVFMWCINNEHIWKQTKVTHQRQIKQSWQSRHWADWAELVTDSRVTQGMGVKPTL